MSEEKKEPAERQELTLRAADITSVKLICGKTSKGKSKWIRWP